VSFVFFVFFVVRSVLAADKPRCYWAFADATARSLTAPGTYGPFSLQNLELFERRDDQIAWVDRHREAYTLASAQVEIPCPPFDGDCDGDLDLGDIAAFQWCFSPGVPAEAECQRLDQSGDEGVDLSDFAGLTGALTGPMTPPVP